MTSAEGQAESELEPGASPQPPPREDGKPNRFDELANAFAFCEAQDALTVAFVTTMSDGSAALQAARGEFGARFGTARRRLSAKLRSMLGEKYPEFRDKIQSEVREGIRSKAIDEENLLAFTAEMKKRAKGELDPGIRAVLLAFQYLENPVLEFQRGYVYAAGVPDSRKEHGIDFSIKIPMSWRPMPLSAKNALREFRSESGWGTESLLVLLGDQIAPRGRSLSVESFRAALSRESLSKFMTESGKILDLRPVRINGQHGVIMIGEQHVERSGRKLLQRMAVFGTVVHNRQLFVECLVTAPAGAETMLGAHYKRYEKLFQHMVNSFELKKLSLPTSTSHRERGQTLRADPRR